MIAMKDMRQGLLRSIKRPSGAMLHLAILALAAGLIAGLPVQPARAQMGLDPLTFDQLAAIADTGDDEAQYRLGRAYEYGEGVSVHLNKAVAWYTRAADQGNINAAFRLARLLHEGGRGLRADPERAMPYYNMAARAGHPEAQNWIGYAYQHGIGVEQNYELAVMWYRRSAKWGIAAAQNNLGLMFLTGEGVRRDYNLASALFEQAVRQGYQWAQNNLAGMYEMGWGVERDMDKARWLYQSAAAQGNPNAEKNLARLMREARGKVIPKPKPTLLADGTIAEEDDSDTADTAAVTVPEEPEEAPAPQVAEDRTDEAKPTPAAASARPDSLSALARHAPGSSRSVTDANATGGDRAANPSAGGEAGAADADDEPGGLKVDSSDTVSRD